MTDWLIKNVGLMLSGDVGQPILDADSLLVREGLIAEVGLDLAVPPGAGVIDAAGSALCPD